MAIAGGSIGVAYIVPNFSMGGYERSIAYLCNCLSRGSFRPMVICLGRNGTAEEWLEVNDVPIVALHKKYGNDWKVLKRLTNALREHEVSIAHSHNWGTLIETSLATSRAGVSHVHAERGTVLGDTRGHGARHWLRAKAMQWALRRADRVISNAEDVAKRVEQHSGYAANKIKIIPNGVRVPHVDDPQVARREIRAELGINDDAIVTGSVGRLQAVKGFEVAIEAIAKVVHAGLNVHFLMVGDGPLMDGLVELVRQRAVYGNLHFVGRRNDVGRWLTAMDLYINSSHSEGMSQSLVEAMATGLPVVASDVGDNARVVRQQGKACGIIVPPGDPQALANAITSLVQDKGMRCEYSQQSRLLHAEHFSFDRMIQQYELLYQQVVSSQ